jgi:hypothetical protein
MVTSMEDSISDSHSGGRDHHAAAHLVSHLLDGIEDQRRPRLSIPRMTNSITRPRRPPAPRRLGR